MVIRRINVFECVELSVEAYTNFIGVQKVIETQEMNLTSASTDDIISSYSSLPSYPKHGSVDAQSNIAAEHAREQFLPLTYVRCHFRRIPFEITFDQIFGALQWNFQHVAASVGMVIDVAFAFESEQDEDVSHIYESH